MRHRILKGLGSRRLPCGCVAGVYETYHSEIVLIVDVPAEDCGDRLHREGKPLPVSAPEHSRTPAAR